MALPESCQRSVHGETPTPGSEGSALAEDHGRRDIILSVLPQAEYLSALDIGCGDGFISQRLPAARVLGIDNDAKAIRQARTLDSKTVTFQEMSLWEMADALPRDQRFDLIVVSGVLYPDIVGEGLRLVYSAVDRLLEPGGTIVSAHINRFYRARFPYLLMKEVSFPYLDEDYLVEVYVK